MWILILALLVPRTVAAQINSVPISITSIEAGPYEKSMASLDVIAHRLQSALLHTKLLTDDRDTINAQLGDFIERLSQIRQTKPEKTQSYENLLKESIEEQEDDLRNIIRESMLAKANTINPVWQTIITSSNYISERTAELCPESFKATPSMSRYPELLSEAANELSLAMQYKDLSFVRYQLREMDDLLTIYLHTAEDVLSNCE